MANVDSTNPLDAKAIINCLPVALAKRINLDVLQSVDSTNLELHRQLGSAASGTVCLAEQQTAGRGRLGRPWHSPLGVNLYCSVLWRFERDVTALNGLSLAVGVAACRALTELNYSQAKLKWPNDLVVIDQQHRLTKLGGILIEVDGASGQPCSAIIGIGINCSMPASSAESIDQPWTDLTRLGDSEPPSRNLLAAVVLRHCFAALDQFSAEGLAAFRSDWARFDALANRSVRVLIGQQQFDCDALGISDDGGLRCRTFDGQERTFNAGEVSVRAQQ